MGRLKKGEKKKTQMTIRINPEVADRLKSIDKYSSKVGDFIDIGINDYLNWLEKKQKNINNTSDSSCDNEKIKEISNAIFEFYNDDKLRLDYINKLKKDISELEKSSRYYKFHPEIIEAEKATNEYLLNILENWDKTKTILKKNNL